MQVGSGITDSGDGDDVRIPDRTALITSSNDRATVCAVA